MAGAIDLVNAVFVSDAVRLVLVVATDVADKHYAGEYVNCSKDCFHSQDKVGIVALSSHLDVIVVPWKPQSLQMLLL